MTAATETRTPRAAGWRSARQAALDVMLTDAAAGGRAGVGRFVHPTAIGRFAGGLARRPKGVAGHMRSLGSELAHIAAGRSELAPAKGDRRFSDPAWQGNALFRRMMQAYLALGGTVEELVEIAGLDWRNEQQVRFLLANLVDALAPTNFPLTNPQVLKETLDRGGNNLVRGGRRLIRDVSKRRLPAMVDTSKFSVGGNLALGEGSVVMHTEVYELLQYKPATSDVYAVPLLIVPPTINKYYVLDLAPGRSLTEYLVAQGHQVFTISWRNPDREHGHFDFDTYAQSIVEARDAVAEITDQPAVHLMAACSGGILTAGTLGHLVAEGRLAEIASLTLLVCALDNRQAGTTSALATPETAAMAVAESARHGYLDGEALASVFAWLRPNDLVWSYVINNYLLGKEPPAFDILYWNQDTVRLAAGLHRDFIRMALGNALAKPGGLRVLGTDVDLRGVTLDNYIVAGSTDHIVPWHNAYRSTQLLGGDSRFVLSTSGHIQALINPPGPESRSSYRVADTHPAEIAAWEAQAVTKRGSWWADYANWIGTRSGERIRAPRALGSRANRAVAKAPGTYVMSA